MTTGTIESLHDYSLSSACTTVPFHFVQGVLCHILLEVSSFINIKKGEQKFEAAWLVGGIDSKHRQFYTLLSNSKAIKTNVSSMQ